MSRVATAQSYLQADQAISQAREREMQSAQTATKLQAVSKPSDSPTSWVVSRNLKDENSVQQSTARQALIATDVMNATETALAQVQQYLNRTHELALAAASMHIVDAKAPRESILAEVKRIFEGVITTLNTSFNNRSLFGGHQTKGLAFDRIGNYLGDDQRINIEIEGGDRQPINISARELILGESNGGVNIVNLFHQLIQGIETTDTRQIGETLGGFTQAIDQLSLGRAQLGAVMSRVNTAIQTGEESSILRKDAISKIEEADAVRAFTELAKNQTVLKATLQTTQKVLQEVPEDILFK